MGCDDTLGPHVELRPKVKTIPSEAAAARTAFPWIEFEGRWGELQPAFFNGPTGPNMKSAVDRSRSMVGRLEHAELRGADRRCVRNRRDRLLLQRGRARGRGSRPAAPQPRPHGACSRCAAGARQSSWPPAQHGGRSRRSGSRVAEPGVRSSPPPAACTSRARCSFSGSASCSSRWASPSPLLQCGRARGLRHAGHRCDGGVGAGAVLLLVVAVGTDADALGLGARPGGDGLRARRDRRRAGDRPGPGIPARARQDPPARGWARDRRRGRGSCSR